MCGLGEEGRGAREERNFIPNTRGCLIQPRNDLSEKVAALLAGRAPGVPARERRGVGGVQRARPHRHGVRDRACAAQGPLLCPQLRGRNEADLLILGEWAGDQNCCWGGVPAPAWLPPNDCGLIRALAASKGCLTVPRAVQHPPQHLSHPCIAEKEQKAKEGLGCEIPVLVSFNHS